MTSGEKEKKPMYHQPSQQQLDKILATTTLNMELNTVDCSVYCAIQGSHDQAGYHFGLG